MSKAFLVLPYTYCPKQADLQDESNWATIHRELHAVDPNGDDHHTVSFGHWATDYDLVLVRAGSRAHEVATELMSDLDGCPVLDEDDLSEREREAFSEDLTRALNGLTIVANGVELTGECVEYDALFYALDQALNECESQSDCDISDVEPVLRDLGFTYDAATFTWTGDVEIPEWLLPVSRRIDITYDVLTEESVADGDAAERGWVDPETGYHVDDRPEHGWALRDALAFLQEHSVHAETCWTPSDGTQHMSVYGNGEHSPGGSPLETGYCLHVKGMSVGTLMRLARVLKANGVHFANMFRR